VANLYDVGDLVRVTATFLASGGLQTDPSQIWFLYKSPATQAGATHQYGVTPSAIIRTGTGAYYIDVNVDKPGDWKYRWEGTGVLQVAEETGFSVRTTFHL
jgi:hypothetical protein